jgi:hypothetical protein
MGVMSSIKHSKNLQSYLSMAESIGLEISPDMIRMLEDENELLDSKIDSSKYAYIVLKHQYYADLNSRFSSLNTDAKREISRIRDLEKHIYTLK